MTQAIYSKIVDDEVERILQMGILDMRRKNEKSKKSCGVASKVGRKARKLNINRSNRYPQKPMGS